MVCVCGCGRRRRTVCSIDGRWCIGVGRGMGDGWWVVVITAIDSDG